MRPGAVGGTKASLASVSPSTQNKQSTVVFSLRQTEKPSPPRQGPVPCCRFPPSVPFRSDSGLGLWLSARLGPVAGAWGPPGAGVAAADSCAALDGSGQRPRGALGRSASACSTATKPSSSRHLLLNLSLLLGDRPENILKESPAHCHCSQIGYKTERKQKRILPSGSRGCQATWVTAGAVWPGRWARAPSVQGMGPRGLPAGRWPWGHGPEDPSLWLPEAVRRDWAFPPLSGRRRTLIFLKKKKD